MYTITTIKQLSVALSGGELIKLDTQLSKEKQFIKEAVTQFGADVLAYADLKLKTDFDFMLEMVLIDSKSFSYIRGLELRQKIQTVIATA